MEGLRRSTRPFVQGIYSLHQQEPAGNGGGTRRFVASSGRDHPVSHTPRMQSDRNASPCHRANEEHTTQAGHTPIPASVAVGSGLGLTGQAEILRTVRIPVLEYPAMPINFVPDPGQILMCDFQSNGFIRPEMQKIRHCVVISPRYRRHTGCCLIVPLSTVAPLHVEPYHYCIPAGQYQALDPCIASWVKGDMLTHAAFKRLDRPFENGRRAKVMLTPEDFAEVRDAAMAALGVLKPTLKHP